jgi:hypothetical protein
MLYIYGGGGLGRGTVLVLKIEHRFQSGDHEAWDLRIEIRLERQGNAFRHGEVECGGGFVDRPGISIWWAILVVT